MPLQSLVPILLKAEAFLLIAQAVTSCKILFNMLNI
jgi:hypothetical protein